MTTRPSIVTLVASILSTLGTSGHSYAQSVVPPVRCGFEEPDYRTGSIDGQRGWSVQQGRAEVGTDGAHSGQRSLKLFAADPFSQAKLTLAPAVPPAPVMFLDFYVIPAASDAAQQEEFLDVDGARIGLFTDPAKPGEGVMHAFYGDGILDSIERQLGLNYLFDERDGDGMRNLEKAIAAATIADEALGLVSAAPQRPAPPAIDLASGFLSAAATVTLAGIPEAGKIRYTLDGSDPRRAGCGFRRLF